MEVRQPSSGDVVLRGLGDQVNLALVRHQVSVRDDDTLGVGGRSRGVLKERHRVRCGGFEWGARGGRDIDRVDSDHAANLVQPALGQPRRDRGSQCFRCQQDADVGITHDLAETLHSLRVGRNRCRYRDDLGEQTADERVEELVTGREQQQGAFTDAVRFAQVPGDRSGLGVEFAERQCAFRGRFSAVGQERDRQAVGVLGDDSAEVGHEIVEIYCAFGVLHRTRLPDRLWAHKSFGRKPNVAGGPWVGLRRRLRNSCGVAVLAFERLRVPWPRVRELLPSVRKRNSAGRSKCRSIRRCCKRTPVNGRERCPGWELLSWS